MGQTPMSLNEVQAAATAAGFELVKGPTKFSGFILIGKDGERPLGGDYSASLSDVAKYLTAHADDIGGVEDEAGAKIKPVPKTEIDRANRILKAPKITKD